MDENFSALLTWDNILLGMSIIGFSGGIGFVLLTNFRKSPVASADSLDSDPSKEKVTLEELSKNWIDPKKQKKEQVYLKDLYHRWREVDPKNVPENDDAVVHTFSHDRVRKFFYMYIHQKTYFKNAQKQRSVVIQILHMLDTAGDSPSVVFSMGGDPDDEFSTTTHGILRRVSLLNHSLNVAEIVCQLIKKNSPQEAMLMAPDALVCALGHDLGKLPRFVVNNYITGAHPLTANAMLQDVKDFKLLKNRHEIEDAIKRHHHPLAEKEKNPLLRLLREADKKARVVEEDVVIGLDKEKFENQRYVYIEKEGEEEERSPAPNATQKAVSETTPEIPPDLPEESGQRPQVASPDADDQPILAEPELAEELTEDPEVFYDAPVAQTESKTEPKQKPERPKKNKQPAPAAPDQTPSPEAIAKAKADVTAAWREQEAIHGISNPTPEMKAEKAKTVALDGWFNPGKFLDDLEKQINQVDRMRICAVSKHGKVFVSSETMVRLIQKQAKSAKIAWLTEMDEYIDLENNKNPDFNKVWAPLMIGIVDLFREQGFIDSCIRPGYYGNYFEVVSEPVPTPGKRFFIVFLANAFKQTIPQLETKKIANRVLNIKEIRLAKSAREV